MAREITIPEVGEALYKICPKCNENHDKCDDNCAWFGVENPCGILHTDYDLMVVEKEFHDGWRIRDIDMIGEKYFISLKKAQKEIEWIADNKLKGE